MFPALFRRELAGQLAGFGGQTAAGRFVRVVELLCGALWLFHNEPNVPFPAGVVNSWYDFAHRHGARRTATGIVASVRVRFGI